MKHNEVLANIYSEWTSFQSSVPGTNGNLTYYGITKGENGYNYFIADPEERKRLVSIDIANPQKIAFFNEIKDHQRHLDSKHEYIISAQRNNELLCRLELNNGKTVIYSKLLDFTWTYKNPKFDHDKVIVNGKTVFNEKDKIITITLKNNNDAQLDSSLTDDIRVSNPEDILKIYFRPFAPCMGMNVFYKDNNTEEPSVPHYVIDKYNKVICNYDDKELFSYNLSKNN